MKYKYRLIDNDSKIDVTPVNEIIDCIGVWVERYHAVDGLLDNSVSPDSMESDLIRIINAHDGLSFITRITSNLITNHSVEIEIDGNCEEVSNIVIRFISQFLIVNAGHYYGQIHIYDRFSKCTTALSNAWYHGMIRPSDEDLLTYF